MTPAQERWPDFLIIGAAKAGTTALFSALSRHPQVCANPVNKEPRYFAYPGSRPRFTCPGGESSAEGIVYDEQEYLQLFSTCSSGHKAGDASTAYLRHPDAPAHAYARVPTARLIAILRHPVERAFSQWLHLRHKGLEELSDFEAALSAEGRRREQGWRLGWLYHEGGCYGSQLQRWLQYYPREQLLILFHEDWRERPRDTLIRAFEHIGVDMSEHVRVTNENVSSLQPRWNWLHQRLTNDPALRRWASCYVPERTREVVRRSIERINLKPGPTLDPSLRLRLAAQYNDEIDLVESISGRNLRHWRGQA